MEGEINDLKFVNKIKKEGRKEKGRGRRGRPYKNSRNCNSPVSRPIINKIPRTSGKPKRL